MSPEMTLQKRSHNIPEKKTPLPFPDIPLEHLKASFYKAKLSQSAEWQLYEFKSKNVADERAYWESPKPPKGICANSCEISPKEHMRATRGSVERHSATIFVLWTEEGLSRA